MHAIAAGAEGEKGAQAGAGIVIEKGAAPVRGRRRDQRDIASYACAPVSARRPSSTQPSTPWLSFRLGATM